MAAFPPEYPNKLGQAVQARMAEMKRSGRVHTEELDGADPLL